MALGNDFSDITPQAQYMKEIMCKLDFTKIENFSLKKAMSRK